MSGFVLPQYVGGTATGWGLVDYTTTSFESSPAGTDGVALVEVPQLDDDERWLIDHAVVTCTSTSATDLRWYEGGIVAARYLLEQTDNGNFDVSDWPNGLQLSPNRTLLMRWAGCSIGAVGTANLQARILRRRSS